MVPLGSKAAGREGADCAGECEKGADEAGWLQHQRMQPVSMVGDRRSAPTALHHMVRRGIEIESIQRTLEVAASAIHSAMGGAGSTNVFAIYDQVSPNGNATVSLLYSNQGGSSLSPATTKTGFVGARITTMMDLKLLAPDFQESSTLPA